MKAKILIYDLETSPSLGYVWGKWQQDVLKFTQEWYIMCFAYKWAGDMNAWEKMKKYNKQDVILLEKIYNKMNPWDKQSLPLNVMENRPSSCPKCAIGKMSRANTYTHVKTGATYEYYRCMRCKAMARKRVPLDSYKKVEFI